MINGTKNIIITNGKTVLRNLKIEINGYNNQLLIGENVKFYEKGYLLIEGNNCIIEIGDKTTIGSASILCAESNTKVTIGKDCMLGREITIQTGDFHSIIDVSTGKRINRSADVFIGNHVWIGYQAAILKGVEIADNSIVGSFTLVNKKYFDANIALAGVPSKIIKTNVNWNRKLLPID